MERPLFGGRVIREQHCHIDRPFPDFASLHPGYSLDKPKALF
jgi:hypothetical protein